MNAPRRLPRRKLDGVLLFDKPLGFSSNQALQTVRKLYAAEKAGHTGTLDPLATGLLPLCFGEATKFSGELLNANKRYVATVQLGVSTSTADAEGETLERRPINVNRADLESVLDGFLGEIQQIPPMYSALKRDGKPLYEYARAGIELERKPRAVNIYELSLLDWSGDHFILEVSCSKGTYIRTLAADIGDALHCGGHLLALRRTGIGSLTISAAHPLPRLEAQTPEQRDALLQPADSLLTSLATAHLTDADASRLKHGQAVRWSGMPGTRQRVYDANNNFIGVCQVNSDGWLQPERLVANADPISTLMA